MRRLKQEGLSPGLISEPLGVPRPTVVHNVEDIDAPVTQTRTGDVRVNQDLIERIVALLGRGKPIHEVARLTGASRDKVKYWKAKRLPGQPVTGGLRNT